MNTADHMFEIAARQDAGRLEPSGPDRPCLFQILHLAHVDADGRADFRDVVPLGCTSSDEAAIRIVAEHHETHGPRADLWFLRGAGIEGTEIHAGCGKGLHAVTRYRIVMVIPRSFG